MLTLSVNINLYDGDIVGDIEIKIVNKHNWMIFTTYIHSIEKIKNLTKFINDDAELDLGESNAGSSSIQFNKNILTFSVSTGFNDIIPTSIETGFYLGDIELKQFKKEFYKINSIYYVNKIGNWYKYNKKNKILWKIAEYYIKKKYSPNNILKYINLD